MNFNRSGMCLALFAAMLLSACAATPGVDENPIMRKLSWFSYINGDDIRPDCVSGAAENYRLVYNGIYREQVRIYNVDEKSKIISTRVIGKANLRGISVSNPGDLLNPWRGIKKEKNINGAEMARLTSAMIDGGVFAPPPLGLRISSRGFYWTVAACHQGSFYFTAYRWPGERFEDAKFIDVLLSLDETNIALNKPRRVRTSTISNRSIDGSMENGFTLEVGIDGLKGISRF